MRFVGQHRHLFAMMAGILLIAIGMLTFVMPAHATDCGGIKTTVIDCASAKDSTGVPVVAVLVVAIQILTGLIGVVAIGAFVFAGIMYSSAGGNASQIAKAKEIIRNTVIGLVTFAAMVILLNWLIPGGLFTGNAKFGAGGNGLGGVTIDDPSFGGSDITDPRATNTVNLTVATYNIRASNLTSWDNTRANSILQFMKSVDIVGIQEGRPESNGWLNPRMSSAGYARTTVGSEGSARQIYYRTQKFTKIQQGSKELNAKKDLVWIKLQEKTSGTQFYVADVHLDVASTSARLDNLKRALPYIASTLKDAPIIFIGDMNSKRGSTEDKLIQSAGFKDMYDVAATKTNLQYRTTIPNFNGGTSGTIQIKDHQIDHIYIKGNLSPKAITVVLHKGSDHLPVQGTIGIANGKSSGDGGAKTLTLTGVKNYRDLATLNPSLIKPGVIYRSAKLEDATTADRQILASRLTNGAIIDLRTAAVRSRSPDVTVSGVPNLNYPVEGVSDAEGYVRAFVESDSGRQQFGAAITKIANTQGAVLIHCTAGKDRTGWISAMLMYSMGASDAQVMTEYLKSQDAGADFEVDKSWLNAALSAARKNNGGSVMNYITSPTKGLGVSADTITKLKAKLAP